MSVRIITRLDIKGPNLVKGIRLEGLRVLGKPEDFARLYYEEGADELIYMDTVASLYGRNSLTDLVERTATDIAIPLTVGGGIRSIEDIRTVLRAGADKVSINTAAIADPEFISTASRSFGSSTIIVSIEAIKTAAGTYEAYVNYGREKTGVDIFNWAKEAVELGAGELLITSIDRDGTGEGFDTELIRKISDAVPVPVIAHGGGGSWDQVLETIVNGRADAVCLASMIHYNYLKSVGFDKSRFQDEGNLTFLQSGGHKTQFQKTSLRELKEYLASHRIECRM